MHTVTMHNKSKRTTITLPPLVPWKVSQGHKPHRGGSGTHGERRLKMRTTRGDQRRAAVEKGPCLIVELSGAYCAFFLFVPGT